jgi:hypothetical protein
MASTLRSRVLGILLAAVCAAAAWSQITTGSITGAVSDSSGGIITSAKVLVKNQGTGAESSLTTNDAGLYKAAFLTPGLYTVHIQAAGFRAYEAKDVDVQVSRESVINVVMEVGSVGETIQVEGTAPIVQSDSAQLSFNVETKTIVSLPGLQAGVDRIALLSPGIVVGFGNINSNGLVFSANGQRARSNNFLLDGQDNNDPTIGGPGFFFSNLDAIGEFSVISNQYSAEYGRNAGAIVNVRVRSGSNAYHGGTNWIRRDDQNWTALTNLQRATGRTNPPKYLDSIWGGQFEGPIKKDKLFFMMWLQREWGRQDSLSIGTTNLTPTPDGLKTLQAAFPNSVPVQNLVKYGAWGGNKLGNAGIVPGSTVTRTLNTPSGGTVGVEFSAVQRAYSTPQDNWDSGIKGDYHLTSKDFLTGKYFHQVNIGANAASNAQAGYFYDTPDRGKQLGASWVRTFSGSMVNEFRFSFVKTGFFFEGGNTAPFSDLSKNIANISIQTGGNLGYGLATNLPQYRLVNSYQYQDNVSRQWGRHALKFGAQIINDRIPLGFLPFVNGQYIFATFQDYVDNKPSTYNGAAGTPTQEPKEWDQAYYFQDDWKLRRNFTLNLGVRYEYSGQPINLLNDITVARESNPATAIWNTALPVEARTYPRLPTDKNNIAPRVGYAWSPSASGGFLGKLIGHDATVIRGGFSMAYDPSFYNLMLNAQTAAPVVFAYTFTGADVKPMPSDITGAALATLYAPPKGVDPRTFNQTRFGDNFHSPYSVSFSTGIQRRVGNNMGFEIRYVRTRAISQFATRNGNPLISGFLNNGFANVVPGLGPTSSATCSNCNGRIVPNFSNIRIRDNSAQSTYDGLQTRYDIRNLLHQLTLGASYTFSKTIDNISEVFSFAGSGSIVLAQNPFDVSRGERGLSNNHVPHAFSMNIDWDIPGWRHNTKWYGKLFGGWALGAVEIWQSGRAITPTQSSTTANVLSDSSANGFIAGYDTMRPFSANPNAPYNAVGRYMPNGSLVSFTNTSQPVTFNDVRWIYNTLEADKAFGTPWGVSRNSLTGPRYQRTDMLLSKTFSVTEKLKLSVRAEARNAFNHVTYPVPNLQIDVGTLTTFLNQTTGEVAVPRIIQMGARISF